MREGEVEAWVRETAVLCQPDEIQWVKGVASDWDDLAGQLVSKETFHPLNPALRPHSYLCRSSSDDVARLEDRTFICSRRREDAGPTNNWMEPGEMRQRLLELYRGCMRGRRMYVVPFSMAPLNSPFARFGVEITDSPYVAYSLGIMTRAGKAALRAAAGNEIVPCLHSVGRPLGPGESDVPWPSNPENKTIAHFPETREIFSFGSGYGGNALLEKKCLALRIAGVMGRDEGWLAEHMLILAVESPEGEKDYVAAAFPSACGKTNFAMLSPPAAMRGWKVTTLGEDIAWLRPGQDGRLYAINPEAGMFGVAPGTSPATNANAMRALAAHTVFTNVAMTEARDVWWEGLGDPPPGALLDWRGNPWTPGSPEPAAHPNARYTVSMTRCPTLDPAWDSPEGVPLSAIAFGGRRAGLAPLIFEARDWDHGVFLGASLASETTAAAAGAMGKLRRDPMAMLPFCGYHMGDYFAHWLDIGAGLSQPPRFFHVNWFRKENGRFLWPGFGENMRVLRWMAERTRGKAEAAESPLGAMPRYEDFDWRGLEFDRETFARLQAVDAEGWKAEAASLGEFFTGLEPRLPRKLESLRQELLSSL